MIGKTKSTPKELTKKQQLLLNAIDGINHQSASFEFDGIGFAPKCLVSATLPYKNPTDKQLKNGCWVRTNGRYSLIVQGGVNGLPYGKYPRLFSLWLAEEAIRTGSRHLATGGSLLQFFKKIGVDSSRGRQGAGRSFLIQTDRFLSSRILYRVEDNHRIKQPNMQISDDYELFWDPRDHQNKTDFESFITLSESFFNEITLHSIPHDKRALSVLSAMEIDIYLWLAYRYYTLKKPSYPTWSQLAMQFGSVSGNTKGWRQNFKKALRNVMAVYLDAKLDVTESGITLMPSRTPINSKIRSIGYRVHQ